MASQAPFGGAGAENLAQSRPQAFFSIRHDACFHPAHPIQTLSTRGRAGAPTRRVFHRVAHCQRHNRCFVVSTRPSPRLSCRITAPAAALPSGAASHRVRAQAGINMRHVCMPAARHAYKILSWRHCWASSRRTEPTFSSSPPRLLHAIAPPRRRDATRP
jgi:hypothetical protein